MLDDCSIIALDADYVLSAITFVYYDETIRVECGRNISGRWISNTKSENIDSDR